MASVVERVGRELSGKVGTVRKCQMGWRKGGRSLIAAFIRCPVGP